MNTNVKPGDLAYVVAPYVVAGRGAFVTVLERAPSPHAEVCGVVYETPADRPAWIVEGWVRTERKLRGPRVAIADDCLRRVPPSNDTTEEDSVPVSINQPVKETA